MFKERKYRIKSINYNVDTYPDDIDKISISSANYQNKNSLSNKDNNFINPSIEVKKIISSDQKQYNALKSLQENKDKYNSFSDEVELSFEKNNTLMNDTNRCINKEKIYKKILENNKKKNEIIRPVKIIKCEKINANNKNERIFKSNIRNNHAFFESKSSRNSINKKNLILKTDCIDYDSNNISLKPKKENKYKDNKNEHFSFEYNNKFTPILSNRKEENQIILNHSIVFINQKSKEQPENIQLKEQRKILKNNIFKCEKNKITNEIKKKGYMDSTDFMKAINEENKKNKNNENIIKNNKLNEQRNKKVNKNKKIIDKKIIELLKKINSDKNKNKEKENIQNCYNNIQETKNINTNINNENANININKNAQNLNCNREIEELKNNLNIKNFNDIKKKVNNFNLGKKKIKKSLKLLQIERDNFKILKQKIIYGPKGDEIARILETKQNNENEIAQINKLNNQNINNQEKSTGKKNIKNKTGRNIIVSRNNQVIIKEDKICKNIINDKKMITHNKKGNNLEPKPKKLGINLTRKIKKYYSKRNKTFEEINNNSYKNISHINHLEDKIKHNNNQENITNNEINDINKKIMQNSNITNFFNKTMDINYNYNPKILSNNVSENMNLTEHEKSNFLNKYNNNNKDIKQTMNLTTRDETGKINNNSKDTENNEVMYLSKDLVNENNQVKSCESQVISGINGPNTTYFSGFNKSDLKILNKVNLDMPVNIDLEKEENEDLKNEKEIKVEKEKKENKEMIVIDEKKNCENKNVAVDIKEKDKKIEKLENFINEFNEDENENKEVNIINYKNESRPSYGRSVAEINFLGNEQNFKDNQGEINENKINDEFFNMNNNVQTSFKSNFYDDIQINNDNLEEKNNYLKDNQSYGNKKLESIDINIDSPNNDQDFLDKIELIQKNNFRLVSPKVEKNKEENKTENETIKELETEYEFNLDEEKFCEPLQKYENKISFEKINPF